jgi:hypothetical protein
VGAGFHSAEWLKRRREAIAPGPRAHGRLLSRVPEIAELQKSAPAGCCAFCEDPLPPGSKAICCGQRPCRTSYNRLFTAHQRELARQRAPWSERFAEHAWRVLL